MAMTLGVLTYVHAPAVGVGRDHRCLRHLALARALAQGSAVVDCLLDTGNRRCRSGDTNMQQRPFAKISGRAGDAGWIVMARAGIGHGYRRHAEKMALGRNVAVGVSHLQHGGQCVGRNCTARAT